MIGNDQSSQHQLLQSIGFTSKLPMAVRSTIAYEVNNEQQLLKKTGKICKLGKHGRDILASVLSFPYKNERGFKLIIDDEFLAQSRSIKIHGCSDFKLVFTNINQALHKSTKFFIEISSSDSFVIEGLDLEGGLNVILITNSTDFLIKNCSIRQANGYAIIIHQSKQFQIRQCVLENNLASGIMLLGDSKNALIRDCQCRGSTGYFNFDAGIHLCATSPAITLENIPEQCHEMLSIEEKTERPYGIVIEHCVLNDNRAQGIYMEGAVNCLLKNNQIFDNNKEGVCLDWGSCFNIFTNNLVSFNGERKGLSKAELKADFITGYPLLKDGSSSMKLPGISVDNGCMNLIALNKVTNNYGGGVKFIRSSLLNEVKENFIALNALGSNKYMHFYHGISVSGLGAINKEFKKNQKKLLDFLPSQLNAVSGNTIKGHYLAIYYDKASTENVFIKNDIDFYECYKNRSFFMVRRLKQLLSWRQKK